MSEASEEPTSPEEPDVRDPGEACVRVRLGMAGVQIAFAGRRAFFEEHVAPYVEAIYARAQGGAAPAAGSTQPQATNGEPSFQPSSPRKFQQFAVQIGANAATVEQRVMAFAFYLWNYERRDEFVGGEIASFFRTVHEAPPEDLPQLLQDLSEGKRFLEAGEADAAWRLTTKGVNYVKNRLLGATG